MTVDHIAATGLIFIFFNNTYTMQIYNVFRMIGRVAFPIYLFLIVEGFIHTKNIKKYIIRIVLFAIISEIPFDMAFNYTIFEVNYQNVMWTLLICVIMLYFMRKYPKFNFITVIVSCLLAMLIRCDYAYIGPLAAACMYLLRERKLYRNMAVAAIFYFEPTAIFSLIPINMYSEKKGTNIKYFFYAFYPVHLLVLTYIRHILK